RGRRDVRHQPRHQLRREGPDFGKFREAERRGVLPGGKAHRGLFRAARPPRRVGEERNRSSHRASSEAWSAKGTGRRLPAGAGKLEARLSALNLARSSRLNPYADCRPRADNPRLFFLKLAPARLSAPLHAGGGDKAEKLENEDGGCPPGPTNSHRGLGP